MKIYLLMLLIGTLLTAIHFTSAPEQQSEDASAISFCAHLGSRPAAQHGRKRQHAVPRQNLLHLCIGQA